MRKAGGTLWEDQSLMEWDPGELKFLFNTQVQDCKRGKEEVFCCWKDG